MKWIVTVVLALVTLWMIGYEVQQNIVADYQFEKAYGFAWNLADKSSTIEAKAGYIAQFVGLMESTKNLTNGEPPQGRNGNDSGCPRNG